MATTFHPITAAEMDEFLGPQGYQRIELPGTVEAVYAKRVDADGLALSARVYTGINPNGASREKGTDAIRVNLFWRRPDGELRKVNSSARVHRVKGWRANLQTRLDAMKVEQSCPRCGSPMVARKQINPKPGTSGEFWGCADYPNCTKTAPMVKP